MVHRERGRVDAILTGIGTVIEDDPQLTPRGVRVQRMPRRVVFDPGVEIPIESRLCDGTARTTLLVGATLDRAAEGRLAMLRARGVDAVALGADDRIEPALRTLAGQGVSTVLVEAGWCYRFPAREERRYLERVARPPGEIRRIERRRSGSATRVREWSSF